MAAAGAAVTTLESTATTVHAELAAAAQNHDVVVNKEAPLPSNAIRTLKEIGVKLIIEAGTGYNNIDVAAARAANICVCNVPTYATEVRTLSSCMAPFMRGPPLVVRVRFSF